jgi:hypothetical protein
MGLPGDLLNMPQTVTKKDWKLLLALVITVSVVLFKTNLHPVVQARTPLLKGWIQSQLMR